MNIENAPSAPEDLQIHCKNCRKLLDVSIQILRDNEPIICSRCGFSFVANIDVEALLKLIKEAEDSMLDSDLIM